MASDISLTVLVTVLSTVDGAQANVIATTARNSNQQAVRAAGDQIAAALRNLASPTPDQPQAIDRATPYDLVFQDVDPAGPNSGANTTNVRRERWCLGSGGVLYGQRQTWITAAVPAMPSVAACPGTGWATTRVVGQRLNNTTGGQARAIFTYDSGTLTDIAQIHVDLWVDGDASRGPAEARVSTGAFLRNQNRRPVAAFTAAATAQGIVLNASASVDPEGQSLTYTWLDGATVVDTGVTATYKVTPGTSHSMSVRVTDPAGLTATSAAQVVIG
jgi:hypothetical protein